MDNLLASWGYIAGLLCFCSAYFVWKCNGGSVLSLGKKERKSGADLFGEIIVAIVYAGFSVGMVCVAAVVGTVCRVLLLIAAVGAANQGDYLTASLAAGITVATAALSIWAALRSQRD